MRWDYYINNLTNRDYYYNIVVSRLKTLNNLGYNISIMRTVPLFKVSPLKFHYILSKFGIDNPIQYDVFEKQNQLFDLIKKEIPSINFLNPEPFLIDSMQAKAIEKNIPLYKDSNHLNYYGALRLVPLFEFLDE